MSEIIDWPTSLIPQKMTALLVSNTKTFVSPFTGTEQVSQFPGSRWKFGLTFDVLKGDKRLQLETLIASLDGVAGRVRLWDFAAGLVTSPQPVYGSPMVSGADQLGALLVTSGWTPNLQVLKAGGWIAVNGELKRVTADVTASPAGVATIPIAPMLRASPASGTPIDVARPCGIFRLADNSQGRFSRSPGVLASVTLEFSETW